MKTRMKAAAPQIVAPVDGAVVDVIPRALRTGPVRIGENEVEASVLPDGRAVFTARGIVRILTGREAGDLASYINAIPREFRPNLTGREVEFRVERGNVVVRGYEAFALTDVFDAYVDAAVAGRLRESQLKFAVKGRIFTKAFRDAALIQHIRQQLNLKSETVETTLIEQVLPDVARSHAQRIKAPANDNALPEPAPARVRVVPLLGPTADQYVGVPVRIAARKLAQMTGKSERSQRRRLENKIRNRLRYTDAGCDWELWPSDSKAVSRLARVIRGVIRGEMKSEKARVKACGVPKQKAAAQGELFGGAA